MRPEVEEDYAMSTSTMSAPPPPGAQRQPIAAAPAVTAAALDPVGLLRSYYPWLIGSGIAGGVLGVVLYLVFGMFMPRYDGKVLFQALPSFKASEIADTVGRTSIGEENDVFLQTQVKLIQTDQILFSALNEPGVRKTQWVKAYMGRDGLDQAEALYDLKKIVSARMLGGTALFEVTVRTASQVDAPLIANAISNVYVADHIKTRGTDARKKIAQFDQNIRRLRTEINSIETNKERLITDNELESIRQNESSYYQQVQELLPRIVALREDRARMQQLNDQYTDLTRQDGPPVYPEVIRKEAEEARVALTIESEIELREATLGSTRAQFGPNHRDVKAMEAAISSLHNQYKKVVDNQMADAFAALLETYRSTIASYERAESQLMSDLEIARAKLTEVQGLLKEYEELETEGDAKRKEMDTVSEGKRLLTVADEVGAQVRIIEKAKKPDFRSFPKPIPMLALSIFLVCGSTVGLIVLRELREQRVRSPRDIALIPRTRVLGIMPELSMDPAKPERIELAVRDRPLGAVAESARQIRTSILKACEIRGHQSIVFCPGMPGSGNSSIITNLAISAALVDKRVLIIDANLRRPSLHTMLDVQEGPGLVDMLRDEKSLASCVQEISEGVSLLTAGTERGHQYERLNTSTMNDILEQAKSNYDLVLLDVAPAVVAGDAFALAGRCDASVLVCRAYSEKRGLLVRLRTQLGDARADFLGVIVNGVRASAGGYLKSNYKTTMDYQEYEAPTAQESDAV